MVKRNYRLLNAYSKRLTKQLFRIANTYRTGAKTEKNREQAMMKANKAFDKYTSLLLPYVYRTRVMKEIGPDAKGLGLEDLKKLEQIKIQSMEDFKAVLNDIN